MRQSERIGASASVALHLVALVAFAAHAPMRPATASQRPLAVTLKAAPTSVPDVVAPAPSAPAARPRHRHRFPSRPLPPPSAGEKPRAATEPTAPIEGPAQSAALPADAPASSAAADSTVVEVAPAFDADYLRNPVPAYPSLARRLREQGRVLLRVHVDTAGNPDEVQLRVSSGFERLDASARETVMR